MCFLVLDYTFEERIISVGSERFIEKTLNAHPISLNLNPRVFIFFFLWNNLKDRVFRTGQTTGRLQKSYLLLMKSEHRKTRVPGCYSQFPILNLHVLVCADDDHSENLLY